MKITGKYRRDDYGFLNVYADNTLYTIAGNGDWGFVPVGQSTAMGQILTQEIYDQLAGECAKTGTFNLRD